MQIKRISLFLIIGILFSMFLFSSNNVYANDLDFKFEIKQGGIDITGKLWRAQRRMLGIQCMINTNFL